MFSRHVCAARASSLVSNNKLIMMMQLSDCLLTQGVRDTLVYRICGPTVSFTDLCTGLAMPDVVAWSWWHECTMQRLAPQLLRD